MYREIILNGLNDNERNFMGISHRNELLVDKFWNVSLRPVLLVYFL